MENNKICPIHIQNGIDLNAVFVQRQEKQHNIEKQAAQKSDEKKDYAEIQSCVLISSYAKPIYAEVERNELMASILQKIDPIDFHEMFARRKSDELERNAMFTIIWDLRGEMYDCKNAYDVWNKIQKANKFKAPFTRAVIYVVESILRQADRVGSGILSRGNTIYMYDGKMWGKVDPTLMMAFVEMVAMRCGMDVDDILSAKLNPLFMAQLHNTAASAYHVFILPISNAMIIFLILNNHIGIYMTHISNENNHKSLNITPPPMRVPLKWDELNN